MKYRNESRIITASGYDFDVEFEYFPPERGAQNRYGVPMEPDSGHEIYILSVALSGGQDVLEILDAGVIDSIQYEIEESIINQAA